MATIQNQAIIQKLVDELELYPALDKVPTELAEKILPVFQVNADEIITKPEGTLRYLKNETLNENDRIITVPSGKKWEIKSLTAKYISNATVGDRYIRIEIRDDSNNIIFQFGTSDNLTAPPKQTASKTYTYQMLQAMMEADYTCDATGANYSGASLPFPVYPLILLEGWDIRVYDANDVSATDDMATYLLINESEDEHTD